MRIKYLRLVFASILSFSPAYAQKPVYAIRTVAGSFPLGDGGPAVSALLDMPNGVAIDRSGNTYVLDDSRIRKIRPDGVISTFKDGINGTALAVDEAGNLIVGQSARILRVSPGGNSEVIAGNGIYDFGGDDGPAASASITSPSAIAVDFAGTIYFTDEWNHRVRKIGKDGMIRTIAGTGEAGYNGDNLRATTARLDQPSGIALDPDGNVYISDFWNSRVRKISPAGIITTVAGDGYLCFSTCGDGGAANLAQVPSPRGLWFDRDSKTLYIADPLLSRIRTVGPDGNIRPYAGSTDGFAGDGGMVGACKLYGVSALTMDAQRNVYIADTRNHRIRKVANGIVNTIAGTDHFAGDGRAATSALLNAPDAVVVDKTGVLYIADTRNHRIRRVAPDGTISTYAGTGEYATKGDGGPASKAAISLPGAMALDAAGNLYVATDNRVRRISASGVITTYAGAGDFGFGGNNGPASAARFFIITALALDAAGNLYLADSYNYQVRMVSPSGTITAFAGTGNKGFKGDGGLAKSAEIGYVEGLAVDKDNNVFISDTGNHRIRKVTTSGIIITVAGNDKAGVPTDGEAAAAASLFRPAGLAVDSLGNLYIALPNHSYVYALVGGYLYCVAGDNRFQFAGDGGIATAASLRSASQLSADSNSDIYVADTRNHRIRKLVLNSATRLEIAGGNEQSGVAGQALPAPLKVKLTGRAGIGLPDVWIAFEVAAGSATLSANRSATDMEGLAGVAVTFGATAGNVAITATAPGLPPVRFSLTATQPPPPPAPVEPNIRSITGAGFSDLPVRDVAPLGLMAIQGVNLGPGDAARTYAADQGRVLTKLDDVCVQVGNALAPVLSVSKARIIAQTPLVETDTATFVAVIRNCGQNNEVKSNAFSVFVRGTAPEFLHNDGVLAALNFDQQPIGPTNPAKAGETVTILGTGFGATSPALAAGDIPTQQAATVEKPVVTIGAVELTPEDIMYCGAAPNSPGVYQLVLRVPAAVEDGMQPIRLRLGGSSTPEGDRLPVAH